jgi:GNAT superfamily N-acetyltransferase
MPVVYFKRYRMAIELAKVNWDTIDFHQDPASEIHYCEWSDKQISQHALAKWESFRNEIDAIVFPCLGEKDGCRQLMRDLSMRANFVPEATWLATTLGPADSEISVGTIQGLRVDHIMGAIQNVGVIPRFRGMGVGRQLIMRALRGFYQTGCRQAQLEVTIHNIGALRLYESIGFQCQETVFKVGNVPVTN